jgi:two-component system, response regulator YesN
VSQGVCRQSSKETGESFVSWLNRFRIEKAEEIMQIEPDSQIYEIAERVGFDDYKNFYANFKKYLGVPPREYKSSPR